MSEDARFTGRSEVLMKLLSLAKYPSYLRIVQYPTLTEVP